jgi:hypothetical protein
VPQPARGGSVALLQPWENMSHSLNGATLKGVAPTLDTNNCSRNSFRVATSLIEPILNPGFQSKPWAGICELLRSNKRSSLALLTLFLQSLSPFAYS